MKKEAIMKNIIEIFQDVFDDEGLVITEKTSPLDIDAWDSLEHIKLILACETTFSIKFSISEMEQIKNVGDMVELISRKQDD